MKERVVMVTPALWDNPRLAAPRVPAIIELAVPSRMLVRAKGSGESHGGGDLDGAA
jgi:hypothetical protein